MLRFSISHWVSAFHTEIFLTLRIPLKEGLGGDRQGEDRVTLQISLMPKRNSRNLLETPAPRYKATKGWWGCCTVSQKFAFHLLVKQKSNRKSSTPSLPSKRLASQSLLTNDNDWRLESPMETLVDLISLSIETGVWCFSLFFQRKN
jgi:hypothetical protein